MDSRDSRVRAGAIAVGRREGRAVEVLSGGYQQSCVCSIVPPGWRPNDARLFPRGFHVTCSPVGPAVPSAPGRNRGTVRRKGNDRQEVTLMRLRVFGSQVRPLFNRRLLKVYDVTTFSVVSFDWQVA